MSPLRKNKFNFVASSGRILLLGMLMVSQAANVSASGAAGPQNVPDYASMSLEDLMNQPVTSVTKHTQKVGDSAAAIFVITQEDIRRSGATSIPDALRMVPGVEVAQIDQNKWAIASRGFNGRFDDKLLVLIDGRSVYTPLFSGVYWNIEDVVLEDVDRIEVIRGPGATLWGANAVNGVINIITKSSRETQGGLALAGGGQGEKAFGGARYGGRTAGGISYRASGNYVDRDALQHAEGKSAEDPLRRCQGGFRPDWDGSPADAYTVQGDLYRGLSGEAIRDDTV